MNKKYYLIIATTLYDGLEFTQNLAVVRTNVYTQQEAEKEALKYMVHEDSGEELDRVELIEMTKDEYDVLKKFHI
jgi:hypothetical protein